MPTFKGRWTARVEQDFEIEAKDEAEARKWVEEDMRPINVVELLDMEIDRIEEVV